VVVFEVDFGKRKDKPHADLNPRKFKPPGPLESFIVSFFCITPFLSFQKFTLTPKLFFVAGIFLPSSSIQLATGLSENGAFG